MSGSAEASAFSWNAKSGELAWEAGLGELVGGGKENAPPVQSWGQILDAGSVAALQRSALAALGNGTSVLVEVPVVAGEAEGAVA